MSTQAALADMAALEAEIVSQTAEFNQLRISNQPIDNVKKTLAELKKSLALAKNAGKPKDKEKKKADTAQSQ